MHVHANLVSYISYMHGTLQTEFLNATSLTEHVVCKNFIFHLSLSWHMAVYVHTFNVCINL